MNPQTIQLQLYTKPDCSLCDEAKTLLQSVKENFPIQIEEIDISTNLRLFLKYKYLIPVLEMDGKRLFIHRINRRKLQWQLRQAQWRRFLLRLFGIV